MTEHILTQRQGEPPGHSDSGKRKASSRGTVRLPFRQWRNLKRVWMATLLALLAAFMSHSAKENSTLQWIWPTIWGLEGFAPPVLPPGSMSQTTGERAWLFCCIPRPESTDGLLSCQAWSRDAGMSTTLASGGEYAYLQYRATADRTLSFHFLARGLDPGCHILVPPPEGRGEDGGNPADDEIVEPETGFRFHSKYPGTANAKGEI